ncbi:MAG: CHAT domain-containing protein, partial [Acidobacteriales bacterium]|nr:CHAT domain-containing protein [Terriglobales bacterium]
MIQIPELEISLHRSDEESYSAMVRYRDPDNREDWREEDYPIKFDMTRLATSAGNLQEHGAVLGKSLLTQKIRDSLARVQGALRDRPLRLRLSLDRRSWALHRLRWETLRDPDTGHSLATDRKYWLSRHLSSFDSRPVRLRPKRDLRVLIAAAGPTNLDELGKKLMAINSEQEVEKATEHFAGVAFIEKLPHVTLKAMEKELENDYDVLYLICHGALFGNEPRLLLEDEQRKAALVSGKALVEMLRYQLTLPRLIVMASCQSAGAGDVPTPGDDASLVAIGPRLAEIGVPAVVAMHGNLQ